MLTFSNINSAFDFSFGVLNRKNFQARRITLKVIIMCHISAAQQFMIIFFKKHKINSLLLIIGHVGLKKLYEAANPVFHRPRVLAF
jgi:hypothetical protein